MLYPCNRYLHYDVSRCFCQNLLRCAYRPPEAVLSLAQMIYCNDRLEETRIFRTDNFKDVYSICMTYCIHKSWMLIKNTSTKYKCVSLSYIQFSLSLLISGNIYFAAQLSILSTIKVPEPINVRRLRVGDRHSGKLIYVVNSACSKINPGRGGLSCLQAGTWSTPALCDVVISRTNKTDMD